MRGPSSRVFLLSYIARYSYSNFLRRCITLQGSSIIRVEFTFVNFFFSIVNMSLGDIMPYIQ